MAAIIGGAITAPTLDPVLKSPNAKERSSTGNHSATAFAEPGNPPPSPNPRAKRTAPSCVTLPASPCRAFAADHQTIIRA